MTQAEMERELSATTGESLATIRRYGFQFNELETDDPQFVDWDTLDAQRVAVLPQPTAFAHAA